MVKAFETVLDGRVSVPENYAVLTAAGAALSGKPAFLSPGAVQDVLRAISGGMETLPP